MDEATKALMESALTDFDAELDAYMQEWEDDLRKKYELESPTES